jgi:hypothetical protein
MTTEIPTNYVPIYLPEGKSEHPDEVIFCELRPQIGEYLNQSGCYSKVITILQHFDGGPIEVYLQRIGGSVEFLQHLNNSQ